MGRKFFRRMAMAFLLEEEEERQRKARISALLCLILAQESLRSSIRTRNYFIRSDIISAGSGTAWDHLFRDGSDGGLLTFFGFHREAFMYLHRYFVEEDSNIWARHVAAQEALPVEGRPTACNSYTLLAVGLFYMTNQCRQKVLPCTFLSFLT